MCVAWLPPVETVAYSLSSYVLARSVELLLKPELCLMLIDPIVSAAFPCSILSCLMSRCDLKGCKSWYSRRQCKGHDAIVVGNLVVSVVAVVAATIRASQGVDFSANDTPRHLTRCSESDGGQQDWGQKAGLDLPRGFLDHSSSWREEQDTTSFLRQSADGIWLD